MFTLYIQSGKGTTFLEAVADEVKACARARFHARMHGAVHIFDAASGKVERHNARGEYSIVHNPAWK
jgi:hypothetical protein